MTGTQLDAVPFLEVLGGSGSYSYSAISLPAGLKMDAETGTLSGKSVRCWRIPLQIR